MKDLKMKSSKRVLAAALVAAVIAVLALMGKTLPTGLNITAEDVCSEEVSESGRGIIDGSSSRILFISSGGKVSGIVRSNPLASEYALYYDIAAGDDGYYVVEYISSGDFVQKERIAKYSPRGAREGVVLSRAYEVPDDGVLLPRCLTLMIEDGCGYAVFASADLKDIELVKFPLEPVREPGAGETVKVYENACGGMPVSVADVDLESDTALSVAVDGHLWRLEYGGTAEKLTESPYTDEAIYTDAKTGLPGFTMDNEGSVFPCSPLLAAEAVLFYGAAAFLIIAAVTALIRRTARILRGRDPDGLKRLKAAAVGVGIFLGAAALVAFYSWSMAESGLRNESELMEISVLDFRTTYGDVLCDTLEQYRSGDVESYESSAQALADIFKTISVNGAGRNHSRIPLLLTYSDKGSLIPLAVPDTLFQLGSEYPEFRELYDSLLTSCGDASVSLEGSIWGVYMTGAAALKDDSGRNIGFLVMYTNYSILQNMQLKNILSILFGLLSAAIAVAFIITEGRDWAGCFSRYRQYRREGTVYAPLALIRPLFFLAVAATSTDSTISALVARDMLASSPGGGSATLLAMPLFACSIGMFFGYVVFSYLAARVGQHRATVISLILATVMYLTAGLAVSCNRFWLYVIAVAGAAIGSMSAECSLFRMILLAPDERSRAECNRTTAMAAVTSGALIGLVAGYSATYFGNASVYVISAVPLIIFGIIYVVFVLKVPLPERKGGGRSDRGRRIRGKDVSRFILSPKMLVLSLCVLLPLSLSSGYKSYLFPLFAADEGFDKSMISVMVVLANALVYFTAPAFSGAEEKLGYKKLAFVCVAALAPTLGFFLINSSMLWAVAALVLIGLTNKVCSPCWKMIWPAEADALGVPEETGDYTIRGADGIVSTAKGPILGVLRGLGNTAACAVLAAFFVVSAVVFRIYYLKKSADGGEPPLRETTQ